MSTPTTGYDQQLLCFLQTWRQLLEQWGALTATMPAAAAGHSVTAGPPFMQAAMPPAAPLAPPSPTDYTQQVFGYLQAWRQYLEQMAGARPASPQNSTTPASTANSSGTASATGYGAASRPVQVPPENHTGTAGPGPDDSASRSNFAAGLTSGPATVPPDPIALAPGTHGGTMIPSETGANLTTGLWRVPTPPGRFGGQEPPAEFRPPIYDYGNFLDRPQFRRDAVTATGAQPPPARRVPAGLAARPVGTTFLAKMDRVAPDAVQAVQPVSLRRNGGQTAQP